MKFKFIALEFVSAVLIAIAFCDIGYSGTFENELLNVENFCLKHSIVKTYEKYPQYFLNQTNIPGCTNISYCFEEEPIGQEAKFTIKFDIKETVRLKGKTNRNMPRKYKINGSFIVYQSKPRFRLYHQ